MRKLTLVVALTFALVVGVTILASTIGAQETERSYDYRDWYLQNLWQLHHDDPDNGVLSAIIGLTDTMVANYITPNTGETTEQAKARLSAALGGSPTPLRLYTAAVVESYTVGDCTNYHRSQCFLLEITHWAIAIQVLWPLGTSVAFDLVTSEDYAPEWAMWDIPRPTIIPSTEPSLPLAFDPAGPDRDCSDFVNWRDAQAFFWATENDSHNLDPDGDGVACEDLPGAPQAEIIVEVEVTPVPTPVPTPHPEGQGLSRFNPWPMDGETCFGPADGFCLYVISVDWDAWPEIEEENQFNEAPPEGHKFVLVNLGLWNRGDTEMSSIIRSELSVVGQGTNVAIRASGCGVLPDTFPFADVFPNGTVQGNVCFVVPDSDLATLVLRWQYGIGEDEETWHALRP